MARLDISVLVGARHPQRSHHISTKFLVLLALAPPVAGANRRDAPSGLGDEGDIPSRLFLVQFDKG